MDDEDADVHPSWGKAEDPESIEAVQNLLPLHPEEVAASIAMGRTL